MRPFFIVLEGIDGSGKATQAGLVGSKIFKKQPVLLTREPTGISPASTRVQKILLEKESYMTDKEEFLKLFVEDRKFHIEKIIEPALSAGLLVICERYKYSTFAYQMTQGVSFETIEKLHQGMMIPDLTIILDLDPVVAIQRLEKEKRITETFERKDFLEKVRQQYLQIPKRFPRERIIIINADDSPENVSEKIYDEFSKLQ